MDSTWTSSLSGLLAPVALVRNASLTLLGYVFEAFDKTHQQTVAVKRTTKAGEYVSREFEVLDRLKDCKNVVRMLDIYYSKNEDGKTA